MADGVNNPSGIFMSAIGPLYLALAPATSAITKPGGKVQKLIEAVISLTARSDVASDRAIPALTLVYAIWAFAGSGAISVAGQAMSRSEGLDNNHPREHRQNMRGLPLRLMSAHHSLMENFPLFASAACLAQGLAPGEPQILNLLGLHVLLKLFIFWPSYVFNISPNELVMINEEKRQNRPGGIIVQTYDLFVRIPA